MTPQDALNEASRGVPSCSRMTCIIAAAPPRASLEEPLRRC